MRMCDIGVLYFLAKNLATCHLIWFLQDWEYYYHRYSHRAMGETEALTVSDRQAFRQAFLCWVPRPPSS